MAGPSVPQAGEGTEPGKSLLLVPGVCCHRRLSNPAWGGGTQQEALQRGDLSPTPSSDTRLRWAKAATAGNETPSLRAPSPHTGPAPNARQFKPLEAALSQAVELGEGLGDGQVTQLPAPQLRQR